MVERAKDRRRDVIHERPREDWHELLNQVTKARTGDDVTIELLDAEFGDAFEGERMPLAYIEYDEHADEASVGVGGRDGRYPVVLRHLIGHPTSILTDSKPPRLPLVVQIVEADGPRPWSPYFPEHNSGVQRPRVPHLSSRRQSESPVVTPDGTPSPTQ